MLTEVSQTEKDKDHMISLIWDSQKKELKTPKFKDTENRMMVDKDRGKGGRNC